MVRGQVEFLCIRSPQGCQRKVSHGSVLRDAKSPHSGAARATSHLQCLENHVGPMSAMHSCFRSLELFCGFLRYLQTPEAQEALEPERSRDSKIHLALNGVPRNLELQHRRHVQAHHHERRQDGHRGSEDQRHVLECWKSTALDKNIDQVCGRR